MNRLQIWNNSTRGRYEIDKNKGAGKPVDVFNLYLQVERVREWIRGEIEGFIPVIIPDNSRVRIRVYLRSSFAYIPPPRGR